MEPGVQVRVGRSLSQQLPNQLGARRAPRGRAGPRAPAPRAPGLKVNVLSPRRGLAPAKCVNDPNATVRPYVPSSHRGGDAERGKLKGKENISVAQQNPTAVAESRATGDGGRATATATGGLRGGPAAQTTAPGPRGHVRPQRRPCTLRCTILHLSRHGLLHTDPPRRVYVGP